MCNSKYIKSGDSMAMSLLERTRSRLEAYYTAEIAILAGQSYTLGSRTLTRANLMWVRLQIKDLENQVAELESQAAGKGRRRTFRVIPRDL